MGTALGAVLAWMDEAGWRKEGVCVAWRIFEVVGDHSVDGVMVEAALRVPRAGPLTMLGMVGKGGFRLVSWKHGLGPEAIAWMVHGVRLCMDNQARGMAEDSVILLATSLDMVKRMAAEAWRWDGAQARRYRQACGEAAASVRTFNAGMRNQPGWKPLSGSSEVSAGLRKIVETRLDMAEACRRLAGPISASRRRRV